MQDEERRAVLAELIERVLDRSGLTFVYREGDVIVPLTKDRVTIISQEDAALVLQRRWQSHPSRRDIYASTTMVVDGARRRVYLHRYLLGLWSGGQGHHKNGRTLDNTRRNLMVVTVSENLVAREFQNSTGHGKVRKLSSGRFQARMTLFKKRRSLGTFATVEEAGAAIDRELLKLFGLGNRLSKQVPRDEVAIPYDSDEPPF